MWRHEGCTMWFLSKSEKRKIKVTHPKKRVGIINDKTIAFPSKPSQPCMRLFSWMTSPSGLALPAPATVRQISLCRWDRKLHPSSSFSSSRPSDPTAFSLLWSTLHQGPLVSLSSLLFIPFTWNDMELKPWHQGLLTPYHIFCNHSCTKFYTLQGYICW